MNIHYIIYNIRGRILAMAILTTMLLTSCVKSEDAGTSKADLFAQLWTIIDEHYCFFPYKQQALGLDWNDVKQRYAPSISENMTNEQLFEVLSNMLAELKDGHVNLSATHDLSRYWEYYQAYPRNYNDSIVNDCYLTSECRISGGLRYRILEDNIGYVRCSSFSAGIGDGNADFVLNHMAACLGLIIDVRSNGGGEVTNAHTLASHFINERKLIGYYTHKTGKGHNDFSTPKAEYLDPAYEGLRWQKPCVVLTNRSCYSATNDFVKCIKHSPNVTIMGDQTGGGSGMPFTLELANGWSLRYSAVVYYDCDMQHTEFGIAPDIKLEMSGNDTSQNRDTFIEKAREYLHNSK